MDVSRNALATLDPVSWRSGGLSVPISSAATSPERTGFLKSTEGKVDENPAVIAVLPVITALNPLILKLPGNQCPTGGLPGYAMLC